MFKQLSFNDAIDLFKEWGFRVEPGPLPGEISLIIEDESCRLCTVFDADYLAEIAAFVLKMRWDNGLFSRTVITDGWNHLNRPFWVANLPTGRTLPPH